ncbi:MAG: HAD family phosphatase [Prevotella sp.]|nr:HAD family phosphatase [Prevotella sp.]
MIKNILFDMGGVVFVQDTPEAFRRFRAMGIDTDYYMGAYGQKDFFLELEEGKIDADEFCLRMAKATERPSVSWDEAQYCWLGYVKEVPLNRLHALGRLREHYQVCLASNTNPFIMDYMRSPRFSAERKPISDYFDALYCSYEMKHCKPSSDFFEYILKDGHMKADECLFLDDSRKNVEAAEALGLHGFLVGPDEDWTDRLDTLLQADKHAL